MSVHKSFWDEILGFVKQKIHLRPHELNIGKHSNDATVKLLNDASAKLIDALPHLSESVLLNAVKLHPNILNGTAIPAAAHQMIVDEANAVIASKLKAPSTATP